MDLLCVSILINLFKYILIFHLQKNNDINLVYVTIIYNIL